MYVPKRGDVVAVEFRVVHVNNDGSFVCHMENDAGSVSVLFFDASCVSFVRHGDTIKPVDIPEICKRHIPEMLNQDAVWRPLYGFEPLVCHEPRIYGTKSVMYTVHTKEYGTCQEYFDFEDRMWYVLGSGTTRPAIPTHILVEPVSHS